MRRTVQLVHVLPSGDRHIDWLIEAQPGLTAPLVSFRLPEPLDTLERGDAAIATRIADHRRRYLWYQGELSDHRGAVTAHARGLVHAFHAEAGTLTRLNLTWLRRGHPSMLPCRISQTVEFTPMTPDPNQADAAPWRISVV